MLKVDSLCLRAGQFRVEDVSLDIAEGEYFVLMGATGAGKSLLVKAVCGLLRAERGRVVIGGRDVTLREPRHRRVGYLPQACGLFPHLDVGHNITFARCVRRMSHGRALEAAGEVVRMLGLASLLERRTDTLSGGERQKVALARALAAEPHVLVLDEPLSALDEPTRREIGVELRRVQRALGIATVHVCHNMEETEALADRVGVMHDGRLVQVGTLESLRRAPAGAAVARLLGIDRHTA